MLLYDGIAFIISFIIIWTGVIMYNISSYKLAYKKYKTANILEEIGRIFIIIGCIFLLITGTLLSRYT